MPSICESDLIKERINSIVVFCNVLLLPIIREVYYTVTYFTNIEQQNICLLAFALFM